MLKYALILIFYPLICSTENLKIMNPSYLDTLCYDDGPVFYLPSNPGDTIVCWFSPEIPCSLVAVQYVCYSLGGDGGIWWAPEYIPGDSAFSGEIVEPLVYPIPVNGWVSLDSFGGPFDVDTFDFFVGVVCDGGRPWLFGDESASYSPPRIYRGSDYDWQSLSVDLVIRAAVLVYGGESIEGEKSILYSNSLLIVQSFPNPFSSITTIHYQIPYIRNRVSDTKYSLEIYDVSGRLIKTLLNKKAMLGRYTTHWDGRDDTGKRLPSGIYFYRIVIRPVGEIGEYSETRKMILIR